jgi:hypothetical protein
MSCGLRIVPASRLVPHPSKVIPKPKCTDRMPGDCQAIAVHRSFTDPARIAGRFFARYCPSSATELFSMCSRIPGQIEPVFS